MDKHVNMVETETGTWAEVDGHLLDPRMVAHVMLLWELPSSDPAKLRDFIVRLAHGDPHVRGILAHVAAKTLEPERALELL